MNLLTAHPKLVTFGIGLAITFVVSIAIGMASPVQANAVTESGGIVGRR